jgi:tetratricopeptide (TPR) repeat protein
MANPSNNNLPAQILVIDDDSTVGQSVEGPLSSYHVKVVNSQDLETAMYHFNNQDFDVVFVELEFDQLSGLALIQKFREHQLAEKRATSFVLMSGKTRPASDDNLMKELLDVQIIIKPFNLIQILPFLSRGVGSKQRSLKVEQFRSSLIALATKGKVDEAVDAAKKNIANLGSKGIQITCEIFEKVQRYQDGLAFISPIADKDSGSILYQYLKGRFLKFLGRHQEAAELLEATYKSSPHHLKRLQMLSDLYLDVGSPEKAVSSMKELVRLSPEAPDMKFELFRNMSDRGFDDEAKKFCQDTTKPADVIRYYNNRGVERSKSGDIDGAIKEYETALKYFPDYKENYRIYYNIALAYIKTRSSENYALAKGSLLKCLELHPSFDKANTALESLERALASTRAG